MQNIYQQDFPVELGRIDCIDPKSSSGCVPGIDTWGWCLPWSGWELHAVSTQFFLLSDMEDTQFSKIENPNQRNLEMCACMFQNVLR